MSQYYNFPTIHGGFLCCFTTCLQTERTSSSPSLSVFPPLQERFLGILYGVREITLQCIREHLHQEIATDFWSVGRAGSMHQLHPLQGFKEKCSLLGLLWEISTLLSFWCYLFFCYCCSVWQVLYKSCILDVWGGNVFFHSHKVVSFPFNHCFWYSADFFFQFSVAHGLFCLC